MKVNTTVEEMKTKGVVYEVPCGECNRMYIGQTGRNLRESGWKSTNMLSRRWIWRMELQHTLANNNTGWTGMQQKWGVQNSITGRGRSWKRFISSNKQTLLTLTVAYRSVPCGYHWLRSLNEVLHLFVSSLSIYLFPPPFNFINSLPLYYCSFFTTYSLYSIFLYIACSKYSSWRRSPGRNVLF